MAIDVRLSHLIAKYRKALDKDSSSRVFAPLAECYRQAGMLDEALVVLRDGLRENPNSILGHIGLAQCYIDKGLYKEAQASLRPFKDENRDNIKLQKTYAFACLNLEMNEEALNSYKMILFMNPHDKDAIEKVSLLEDTNLTKNVATLEGRKEKEEIKSVQQFPISSLDSGSHDDEQFDEWEALDLSDGQGHPSFEKEETDIEDDWEMEKPSLSDSEEEFDLEIKNLETPNQEKTFSYNVEQTNKEETSERIEKPLITHTLVDLYCTQGHYEQAHNLLNKILELNPEDEKTRLKLKEVEEFLDLGDEEQEDVVPTRSLQIVRSEEDDSEDEREHTLEEAHTDLADLVEAKVHSTNTRKSRVIEEKLWLFHEKLESKAKSVKASHVDHI